MPSIRSLASKCYLRLVLLILSLSEIMPSYSYCVEKRLSCIIILAPSGRQPSFCTKYTYANMRSSYNIRLMSNAKCTFLICSYIL